MDSRISSAVRSVVETLETRTLLASISGTFFEDLNNNGQRDGREKPFINATIFIEVDEDFDKDGRLDSAEDLNGNGQLDPGEDVDADGRLDIAEDFNNNGLIDLPNGRLDAGDLSTLTDQFGYYQFTGLPKGRYVVRQVLPRGYGQTGPGPVGSSSGGGDYDLVVRFPDASISTLIRGLFESAAARWEQIITGDLTAQITDLGEVDDMVIDAFAAAIDGPFGVLAFASPTQLRPEGDPNQFLPVRGSMTFDTADIDDPSLYETILHEMAHALGFTADIWESLGLIAGRGLAAPRFLGEQAIAAYNDIFFGITDPDDPEYQTDVPLEGNQSPPGSRDSHWRESVFNAELMSPVIDPAGNPISRVTIGAFADMGYTVDLNAADPYDPDEPFPPPSTPGVQNFGGVPFAHVITVRDEELMVQGQDFANRLNRAPLLDSLKSRQALFLVGENVKLQAFGARDPDAGDSVIAVNFYMETNGLPGLQTGAGGDMYLAQDNTQAGGFRTVIDTGATGLNLSPGEFTFYARAYDEVHFTSAVHQTRFSLFDPKAPPARPTNIRTTAVSSSRIEVTWSDRSDDEFGFRLERSTDPDFGTRLQRFTLPADTTAFSDTGLAAGTRYFYRVRAFNIGMTDDSGVRTQFSRASSPGGATTLSAGEVVVDPSDFNTPEFSSDNVTLVPDPVDPFFELSQPDSIARFAPMLAVSGDYFVYARWLPSGNPLDRPTRANFAVTDANKQSRSIVIDQSERGQEGAEVLLGRFRFNAGNRTLVRITPAGADDLVTIDQIRFKPAVAVSAAAIAAAPVSKPRTGLVGQVL